MITNKTSCDECGRSVTKIHRNYNGHRYCAACYAREFKRRECSKCGKVARILKSHATALCMKCEYDQPCIRCGKAKYKLGKITAYGPACKACSVYFRKAEPCEMCGALSKRLTRSKELGHPHRVCTRCATAHYGTCQACSRYRKLQPNEQQLLVCKKCFQFGEVICPECQETMPAGYGYRCPRCYWIDLLEKRITLNGAAFYSKAITRHFQLFGKWLQNRVGAQKAAITIHNYFDFFCEIDKKWGKIPDYTALLEHFGVAKLRQSLLPMQWMEESGVIAIDHKAKKEDSERRRIATILDKFASNSTEQTLLDSYLNYLLARLKQGKTTLRSIRLALTPAAALLSLIASTEPIKHLPNQDDLNRYLSKKPGQRAAIHGFIRYLQNSHNLEIELPSARDTKVAHTRRKNLEATLLTLMQQGDGSEASKRKWLLTALPYFHGLSQPTTQAILKHGMTTLQNDGITLCWNSFEYWVPTPSWWGNAL